ncbi:MAG TPA: DUF72 domain-containing protein [Sphingomonas sp.]|nr:DUF72 domain-containing protein [Sphingomonas sp.]
MTKPAPTSSACRIGTAGWTIPAAVRDRFPAEGSSLERYAGLLGAAEINSSFHRPHRTSTYARWAASVPADFGFSVKLPKTITHQRRLVDVDDLLGAFADECAGLGEKLRVILVQLPPSLAFDAGFDRFFAALAARIPAAIACEPRHASWFEPALDDWLAERRIARVAADPARHPLAERPGGWRELVYFRLHGSPVMYRSAYDEAALGHIAAELAVCPAPERWCMFDNTASSAALGDALALAGLLAASDQG